MRTPAKPPKNPRPVVAFFLSLAASAVVLGIVLLYDGRALELKKSRAEIHQLDARIAERKKENAQLRASIASARRGELPAEKAAREELHLVHPEDIVLLYPPGTLVPAKLPPAGAASSRSRQPPKPVLRRRALTGRLLPPVAGEGWGRGVPSLPAAP
jgi:cell division protein FtsB